MNVISCSRRTDIPRWHSDWLEGCLRRGHVDFTAPRGGRRSVSLLREDIHSLVLWSKDYSRLLANRGLAARLKTLNPYFHFTITGLGGSFWEEDVPKWRACLDQLRQLAGEFGPERVNWRFDPIVFWRKDGGAGSNLNLFAEIAPLVAAAGVAGCTFSFACWYRKTRKRIRDAGIEVVDPGDEAKLAACKKLTEGAAGNGLTLSSCAQPLWAELPDIQRSQCIDAELLIGLRADGAEPSRARDSSQRPSCLCSKSIDIGSYGQRCGSVSCLYCYAN